MVLGFLGLTLALTYPVGLDPAVSLPGTGSGGDTWAFYWDLWWIKRSVWQQPANPYFTTLIHHPWGGGLYLHSLILAPAVLALPVAIGFNLVSAYNALVVLSFVIGGYGTYGLVRHLLGRQPGHSSPAVRGAAFFGGVVFAFGSYHMIRLQGHLDLTSIQWLPIFVLCLLKAADGSRAHLLLGGAALALNALTCWYYGLQAIVFAAFYGLYGLVADWRAGGRRQFCAALGVGGIGVLLLAPILAPTMTAATRFSGVYPSRQELTRYSADLLGFVTPSPLHPLWGSAVAPWYRHLVGSGNLMESVVFLGYVPLLLAVGYARQLWAYQRFWVACFFAFVALALGPLLHVGGVEVSGFPMPYQLLLALPFGDLTRSASRNAALATLCLAVMAGFAVHQLLTRCRRPYLTWLLLTTAAVAEQLSVPVPMVRPEVSPFYQRLHESPRTRAVLEVPVREEPASAPQRMLFQTWHEKPVYGGYLSRGVPPHHLIGLPGFRQFRFLTPQYTDIIEYPEDRLAAISLAVLQRHDAGWVVIDKAMLTPTKVARARTVAEELFGKQPLYEDGDLVAYEVPEPPAVEDARDSVPFIYLGFGWDHLETSDSAPPRWRWMGEHAELYLVTPRSAWLRLEAYSWAVLGTRRLAIRTEARTLATFDVGLRESRFETAPFRISAGTHRLDLVSLDGTAPPTADDRRSLSLAVSRLVLREVGQDDQSAPAQ